MTKNLFDLDLSNLEAIPKWTKKIKRVILGKKHK